MLVLQVVPFLFVFRAALAQQVPVVPAVGLFIPRTSTKATTFVVREIQQAISILSMPTRLYMPIVCQP